jgi:hypothetical protein
MAIPSKTVQLSLFENEKRQIEAEINQETERSTKKQVKLHFHEIYEIKKRLEKQEEIINKLVDFILDD